MFNVYKSLSWLPPESRDTVGYPNMTTWIRQIRINNKIWRAPLVQKKLKCSFLFQRPAWLCNSGNQLTVNTSPPYSAAAWRLPSNLALQLFQRNCKGRFDDNPKTQALTAPSHGFKWDDPDFATSQLHIARLYTAVSSYASPTYMHVFS